jgi:sugar lactone lactonase YvrE
MRTVAWVVAAAALSGVMTAGCGGAGHAGTTGHSVEASAASVSASARQVPNPFRIITRYSASSLRLNSPADLAIGPDGNLYITDASQRVTVVSPLGRVLRRWGRPGKGPGEFDFVGTPGVVAPIAVGVDGRVYVGDSGTSRVEVFTPRGAFIRQFGSSGYGKGKIELLHYLAVDRDGYVYVADDQIGTLLKFSPSGRFQWSIGGASAADPDLVGHFHFSSSSIDSHGRLLVANDSPERILYIDDGGHKVDAFGSPSAFKQGACDVTVDANGDTFVGSCQDPLQSPHYTEVFDRTHGLLGEWHPSPFGTAPRFGPRGEVFALGENGSILRLRVTLPGA